MTQISINELIKKIDQLLADSKLKEKQEKLYSLQEKSSKENFWQTASAQKVMQEIALLQKQIDDFKQLEQFKNDLEASQDLINQNSVSKDKNIDIQKEQADLKIEIQKLTKQASQLVKKLELNKYLSGKYDAKCAILSIHSGQGGTEAMDWAEMLSRMYLRYFEKKDWQYKFISESRGEEAGIKEASYEINVPYAYGYLKGEQGTHRLVRLSPFNADQLRQTSFAGVEVLPIIDDDSEIELKEGDLSWKFTRAGGAGGQSVNKLNTAVELTHLPSNLVVKCREERSQVQNKEKALKILKAKLALKQEEEQAQELKQAKGEHQIAGWGTQIRNYVLHPYKLVKDTRTGVETSDTDGVLDGNLDQFIEEEIKIESGFKNQS